MGILQRTLIFQAKQIIKDYAVLHPGFEDLDYKATADWDRLPMLQKVKDFVHFYRKTPAAFYIKFYEYSTKYPQVIYDLHYYYKKTRIVKIDCNSESDDFTLRLS
jgi:hypothetical protein